MKRHRRCMVVRGDREGTRSEALRAIEGLLDEQVLWVSELAAPRFVSMRPSKVNALLGRAFDAVVLDLHAGLDPDVLGRCHGLVWGGGSLVLRMPPLDEPPLDGRAALAVLPFGAPDVGLRFWHRFERLLARADALAPLSPIGPVTRDVRGTDEQREVAARLARTFVDPSPALAALIADRGRGKSSALGMALSQALAQMPLRAAVTASSVGSAREVFRFAPRDAGALYVAPLALASSAEDYDVIVVDEAAQLPVPLLTALTRRHARARIAFASTVHGYEGTGRGFALRFLSWAAREHRPLSISALEQPIRWDEGDPLERFVFDALALDAEPAPSLDSELDTEELEHVIFDRDALAKDERTLRELFGLLVHAHYRTTPSDLHRLLDAPNLATHALLRRGHVVAASLVAFEGGLSALASADLARVRVRGHALADTLVCHSARPDAGELSMVRSVRIAAHPALRRRGVARMLVEHVHRSYSRDLFGTIFGVTPELLRFRRAVGYELVRLGVSRGSRTGEPAAVMLRPVSSRAVALVSSLRVELARNLPLQLELMRADGEPGIDDELAAGLSEGLPHPRDLDESERRSVVLAYVASARPFESAAFAITRYVEDHADRLDALDARERALIEGRVRRRRGWRRAAAEAGYDAVITAMRALRHAVRSLVDAVER